LGAIRPEEELRQIDELAARGVAAGERYPDMSTVNRGAAHLSRIMLGRQARGSTTASLKPLFLVQAGKPLQAG
jgi:hypothetical protein